MGNDSRRGLLLCGLLFLLGRAVPLAAQTCASPSIFPAAGGTFSGTTTGTGSVAGSCGSSLSSPEWVFSWTPATSGVATIQLCGAGTTFDTVLYMRVGSCAGAEISTGTAACGGAVGCNDDCAGCVNASGLARASKLTPTVTGGQTYIIVVDGFGTASRGNFTLSVTAPSGGSTTTTTPGATTTTTTTTLYRPPSYPTNLQVKTISCGSTPTVQLTWNASTPGTGTLQGYAVYLWNGQQFVPDQCNTGGCPGGATHSYSCCTGSPNAGILYINGNFPCVGSLCSFTETLDFPGWPFYAVVAFDNSGPSGFSPSPLVCAAPDIGGGGVCGPGLFNGCTPYPCFQCTYNGTTPNTTSWCDPAAPQKCGDCSPCVNPTTTTTVTTTTTPTTTTTLGTGGPVVWAQRFGGTSFDAANAVAVDSGGNVLMAGSFAATVDFGTGSRVSAGGADLVVAKYAPSGAPLWVRTVGGAGSDQAFAVAVDPTGNVFVGGFFQGTVDFGGGSVTAGSNLAMFVAKYNGSNGSLLWLRQFSASVDQRVRGLAVDATGNVVATGYFTGTMTFGGATLTTSNGVSNVYLVKLAAADGAHLWSQSYLCTGNAVGYGVALDSSGSVFVTGSYNGNIDFGGGFMTVAGGLDVFVAKLTGATGTFAAGSWAKRFGDLYNQEASGIAVDGSGNPVLTGYFVSTINFGGGTHTGAANHAQPFVVKLAAADGSQLWADDFTSGNVSVGTGVVISTGGNPVVTGGFQGSINLGFGTVPANGLQDLYVAKLGASNGVVQWAHAYGGSNNDVGNSVAADGSGNTLLTGSFQNTMMVGGASLVSAGGTDIVLVKLGP